MIYSVRVYFLLHMTVRSECMMIQLETCKNGEVFFRKHRLWFTKLYTCISVFVDSDSKVEGATGRIALCTPCITIKRRLEDRRS